MKRLRLLLGSVALAFAPGCVDDTATAPDVRPRLSLTPASSMPLTFTVHDPVGDQTGPVDVIRMVMNFDNTTGAYELVFTADATKPFVGAFRISVHLFNLDVGTTSLNPSLFSDAVNEFDLGTPTTTITLTGVHTSLLAWQAGQRVSTNSLAGTGNPDGTTLFRSTVSGFPVGFLTNEDVIAFANLPQPAIIRPTGSRDRMPRLVVVDHAGAHDATTIQQGIDLVRAGGRVRILPGTYNERVVIYKGLTLGAARDHGNDNEHGQAIIEQVTTGPQPGAAVIRLLTPQAVVIRGLTIRHVGLRGITNTSQPFDLTVENTTFEGPFPFPAPIFSSGVAMFNVAFQSGSQARLAIRNSRIDTDGIGIGVSGDIAVSIKRNVFAVTNPCINVAGFQGPGTPVGTQTDVDIVDNEFNRCGSNRPGFNPNGIRVVGQTGVASTGTVNIIGNTFRNTIRAPDDCNATAILYESYSGRIERNTFTNVVQACAPSLPGERSFPAAIFVGSRIAGILAASPSVRFNDLVGISFAGLRVGPNQSTAIDARCNWWGSASGPSGVGPGTGDAILVETGAATPMFAPWATRSAARRGHHGDHGDHGDHPNACRGDDEDDHGGREGR